MGYKCKGFCNQHKQERKYKDGLNVQCHICDIFYKAYLVTTSSNNGKRCFCCGCYVRKKRRLFGKNIATNRI